VPKRHPSLIPISRDHHDGLVLAVRLRQGKKALLGDWSHDPSWQANHVVQFFHRRLIPHFEAEEKALFPTMKKCVKESVKTLDTLLNQHEELKARVEKLESPNQMNLEVELKDFGDLLERHIRIEENNLFPMFEESIPEDIAEEVGREIARIDKANVG
jgi:hemerythrin-like domain-containing protein